jgi:hypothetical protein
MRFMIEAINSLHRQTFIVENIFVNAYRQYGNSHRELRQLSNTDNFGPSIGEFKSEPEIEGADVPAFPAKTNHLII